MVNRQLQVDFRANNACTRKPEIEFSGEIQSSEEKTITYVSIIMKTVMTQ